MDFRRWLVVGICFCIFSGCKTCQSTYDYCGPMPAEGGDFMYRKNSVLGGDPAMQRIDDKVPDEQETEETGPEPTPAPPPDGELRPDMEMEGDRPALTPDDAADERIDDDFEDLADGSDREPGGELQSDLDDEMADVEDGDNERSASTPEWHAPVKKARAPIRQVQFRDE